MIFVGGVVLSIVSAVLLTYRAVAWRRAAILRKDGVRLSAEVVDVDVHGYYSWRPTAPVARYTINGRTYDAVVGNYAGRAPLGSSVAVRVAPESPWVAVAADVDASLGWIGQAAALLAFGVLVCILAG